MKNHIAFKFLAVFLCACALLISAASCLGIIAVASLDLYDNTVEELQLQRMERDLQRYAEYLARNYAIASFSNCPQELVDSHFGSSWYLTDDSLCYHTIKDENGKVLFSSYSDTDAQDLQKYECLVSPEYPVVLEYTAAADYGMSGAQEATKPSEGTQEKPAEYLYTTTVWTEDEDGNEYVYTLGICQGPVYLVTLHLLPGAYVHGDDLQWQLMELGYTHRYNLLIVLGASLLVFSILLVYLCCAAGKKPKCDTVQPGGLNMLPLDLYAVLVLMAGFTAAAFCVNVLWQYFDPLQLWVIVSATAALALLVCLLIVGFLFACAAQFKMRSGYWWRHSVTGLALLGCIKLVSVFFRWLGKGLRWLGQKFPGAEKRFSGGCQKFGKWFGDLLLALYTAISKAVLFCWHALGRSFHASVRAISRFLNLLPLTWQWLLAGIVMIFVLSLTINADGPFRVLGVVFALALVLYGAHCFGVLLESTKRMSQGHLDTKVDDRLLLGGFQEYASALNSLAGVAEQAARDQMKSERMKAELITNVSHDIKTPLTSIINYVDLMQKAGSPEEAEEYLEVLARQSLRLKKLIDDLMEMSKASTGNMHVDIRDVDAAEAVNQALGEFSDKLAQASLTSIFNPPETPLLIRADGRLVWRVLSNLLSNTVKYALPGTRVYIDLVQLDGKVLISLKNISKEPLNVDSEELMERFVRGDTSRNTEGSGLGLNIARSLMELQKGQLQLLVDGDLFKVTLLFLEA